MGPETTFVWTWLFPSEELTRKSHSINRAGRKGRREGRKDLWSRSEGGRIPCRNKDTQGEGRQREQR